MAAGIDRGKEGRVGLDRGVEGLLQQVGSLWRRVGGCNMLG